MSGAVAVVGSFNQDHVWSSPSFPVPGETRLGVFRSGPGGKGFNQAVAAARLGAQVQFIGALGEDALAAQAMALAAREGLHGHWQHCAGLATGTAAILLDADGQNLIVVGPGANAALSPAHVESHADRIRSARVLLTQREVHPDATLRALEIARAAGLLAVHNPAPATMLPSPLAGLVDVLTPNESEFAALLHAGGEAHDAAAIAGMPAGRLHALARSLHCPAVILTLGARGALLSEAGGYREFTPPTVAVRDTTGAGDCFNGALATELARGAHLADACAFAVRAASCKVERPGAALAMPTRAEVSARFAN